MAYVRGEIDILYGQKNDFSQLNVTLACLIFQKIQRKKINEVKAIGCNEAAFARFVGNSNE